MSDAYPNNRTFKSELLWDLASLVAFLFRLLLSFLSRSYKDYSGNHTKNPYKVTNYHKAPEKTHIIKEVFFEENSNYKGFSIVTRKGPVLQLNALMQENNSRLCGYKGSRMSKFSY